jgi:hypothetical protein
VRACHFSASTCTQKQHAYTQVTPFQNQRTSMHKSVLRTHAQAHATAGRRTSIPYTQPRKTRAKETKKRAPTMRVTYQTFSNLADSRARERGTRSMNVSTLRLRVRQLQRNPVADCLITTVSKFRAKMTVIIRGKVACSVMVVNWVRLGHGMPVRMSSSRREHCVKAVGRLCCCCWMHDVEEAYACVCLCLFYLFHV